ncbi:type I methionyl aminopeptidase [bacterium I07]|nr:type I methionyl aminopeptidase [bacterium I07]
MIPIKKEADIDKMKQSADILVQTFRAIEKVICPGVRTSKLDEVAESTIDSHGGTPAFKGYRGFPASVCVSIDSQVVHGIPGDRQLEDGQLVSVDIGVVKDGYYADAAKTYGIGDMPQDKAELMRSTRAALHRGIKKCREGHRVSDISHAIQSYVENRNYSVVRALVGHGIGTQLHEEPQIPNYGAPNTGPKLKAGMVLAIEPMINMGTHEVKFLDDGWTVETMDGSPSAHFEHTVLITKGKPEVLTLELDDGE